MHVIRCLLAALAALTFAAHAQLRSIPGEAKPGTLRHLQDMIVEVDGKPVRLSPGAQIRDTQNRLVLPASMTERTGVRYVTDATGMVHRVWILSPEEVAGLPKPNPPAKKAEKKKAQK